MLAKSKLNSIETLVWRALIDMEISHEEYITNLKEKDQYEKMKENMRSENGNYEVIRLSKAKSKELKQNLSKKLLSVLCHQKIYFFLVYV